MSLNWLVHFHSRPAPTAYFSPSFQDFRSSGKLRPKHLDSPAPPCRTAAASASPVFGFQICPSPDMPFVEAHLNNLICYLPQRTVRCDYKEQSTSNHSVLARIWWQMQTVCIAERCKQCVWEGYLQSHLPPHACETTAFRHAAIVCLL